MNILEEILGGLAEALDSFTSSQDAGPGEDGTPLPNDSSTANFYSLRPLSFTAIQLQPYNLDAVAAFLLDERVPFAFCGKTDDTEGNKHGQHLHILRGGGRQVLAVGSYIVVEGSRDEQDFKYRVVSFKDFHRQFEQVDMDSTGTGEGLFDPDEEKGREYRKAAGDMTGSFPVETDADR